MNESHLTAATIEDAAGIAALRTAVAERLTRDYGHGHWSSPVAEKSVFQLLRKPGVFVVRDGGNFVATLRFATKKPWAIDIKYFTQVERPLYLLDMAVDPQAQRQGIGRRSLEQAMRIAEDWPSDAIRLDAYDSPAGAGEFYAKCGFRETGRVVYKGNPLIYYERLI